MASVSSTINSRIDNLDYATPEDLDKVQDSVDELEEKVDSISFAPDYSKGISISLPYTVTLAGYIYAGVDGVDSTHYVYVNNKPVHGHCGYSGGKSVYSGSVFMVSLGDYVTCSKKMGSYYFYPFKEVI